MSTVLGFTSAAAAIQHTALLAQLNGTTALVYAGTKPTDSDTAVGAQTLLATITLANPAGVVSGHALTFSSTALVTVVANGTPTWVRLATGDGDVTISGGGGALTFDSVTWEIGGTPQITGGTITLAA